MSKDFKVGIVVFSALIIFFLGLMWLKGISVTSHNRVLVARFDDTIGLLEGDPVFIRGVKVGKVDQIQVNTDHVAVKLVFETDAPVFTDASARIGMLEILAGKKVDLIPGISGLPIPEGSAIPGSIGADIPVMLNRVNEVSDDLKHLIKNMNMTLVGLNSVLTDKNFQQNSLLLVDRLAVTSSNLATMTDQLNDNSGTLKQLLGQMNELTATLNSSVTNLTPKAGETLQATTVTMQTLNNAVMKLSDALEKLDTSGSLAHQLMYDRNLATKFNATIDSLNLFLNHIREKPVKLDVDLW